MINILGWFKQLSAMMKYLIALLVALTTLTGFWYNFIYPDFEQFKNNSSVEVHVHLNTDHIEPHWTTYRVPCDPHLSLIHI